jgi:putative ABC transport system permease protein
MDGLLQDLRYGLRTLARSPSFTLIAVIALALGIGANTAIFSVVYGVLLRPLPYKDADRIVIANISPPDFRDVKEANQVFDRMSMWASNLYNVTIDSETTQVRGAVVTPGFFEMLGQPVVGRVWGPEEDNQPLIVISRDFWRNSFGDDPTVIGKTVRLSGNVYTIIGVMPEEFQYPTSEFKLWTTMGLAMSAAPQQAENRQFRIFRAVAHLKPGITMAQMRVEMETISQRLEKQYPDTNAGARINFTSLYQRIVGDVRPALLVLLGTVGFVLLIACANVANLTLARIASREREIAIRTALGAGRWRVARQLLTESLLLAIFGGVVGILLAMWGIDVLPRLGSNPLPRSATIDLSLPVLLFTLALSVLTGVLFGVIPALQATRANLSHSLKEGGRGAFGSQRGRKLRSGLVVIEFALSLVVLIGAGLLLKSFIQLLRVDAGIVTENLLTANVGLVQFKDPQQRAAIQRQTIERIAAIPGVQAVGAGTGLPPANPQRVVRFAIQGLPNDNVDERSAYFIAASPDLFRALGARLVAGRAFTVRDDHDAAKVVILNRTLAEQLFPGESALGKRLQLINPEQSNEWREIVGVVGDVRYGGLNESDVPTVYTPFAQTPFIWNYLVIRSSVAPESLTQSIRQTMSAIDPSLEAADFRTMDQLISESVSQPRFYTVLIGAFALLALILATVGIYGVMSYAVTQRTHEIGVRMALGAGSRDVIRMVITQGMSLALIGVAIGLVAAFWLTRLMRTLVFAVSVTDPLTFAGVSLALATVALLACYLPARRATRVDPLVSLRYE